MRNLRRYECALEIVGPEGLDAALAETDLLVNCTSVGSVDSTGTSAERLLNVLSTPLARIPEPEEADVALSWAAGVCSGNIATSIERLAKLPQDAVVYDIVYRPRLTMLLELADALCRRTLGGLTMNLEQAVIACQSVLAANPLSPSGGPSTDALREVMARVP